MRTPPVGDRRGGESLRPRRHYVRRVVVPGLLAVSAVSVPNVAEASTSQQVSVASIPGVGNVLVSGHRVLYVHTGDTKRHSTCTGACAVAWPPLLVSSRGAHHLGHVHSLGTFRRANGRLQVTIKGQPLYFFGGDKTLTSAMGQGFANVFWTIRPNGTVVHVKPAAAPAPAPPAPTSTPSTPSTPSTRPKSASPRSRRSSPTRRCTRSAGTENGAASIPIIRLGFGEAMNWCRWARHISALLTRNWHSLTAGYAITRWRASDQCARSKRPWFWKWHSMRRSYRRDTSPAWRCAFLVSRGFARISRRPRPIGWSTS